MTETLTLRDLPEVAPEPAPAVAKTSAIATGIANVQSEVAKFDQIAAGLLALEKAHPKNVIVGAIETSAGMKVAEAGWRAYRNPRLEVERARKAAKQPVLALGRAIDDFAGQLETTLREGEDHYKAQIDKETARQDAERAEKARIEAERVAKIREIIAGIGGFAANCRAPGMTSERIAKGIVILQTLPVAEAAFDEFYQEALTVKVETLAEMNRLHVAAVAREEESARLEAQRLENERQAAENARVAAELKRQAAELAAALAESARLERRDAAHREAEELAATRAKVTELPEGQGSQQVLKAEPATADATDRDVPAEASPRVGAMGAGQAADAAPVVEAMPGLVVTILEGPMPRAPLNPETDLGRIVETEAPTLRLSDMGDRLSFIVGEKFLTRLGFEATPVKSAQLYRESQWPAICDAIITHVAKVKAS